MSSMQHALDIEEALRAYMPYEYNALVEFTCIQEGAPAWRTKLYAQTRAPAPILVMASSPEACAEAEQFATKRTIRSVLIALRNSCT